MFYDASNELKEGVFSLMGNPDTFIDLLIKKRQPDRCWLV